MLRSLSAYLKSVLKSPEIRDKIFFSIVIMVVYRLLAAVPVVGIPADAIKQLFAGSAFGDTLSTVSGGVLETASVIAIGIGPYINASIVIQLLTSVIPKLEELKNEGSSGRRVLSMYTRYLTLPLAILQSFVIYSTLRGFGLMSKLPNLELIALIATLTAGAMFVMWMGELVAEDGVGNGSSYLIFLGIVASLPNIVFNNIRTADTIQVLWFLFIILFLVAVVIFISEGERRVKVMYSRRVRAKGMQDSYIPVKATQFGVLPVIFAVSLLSFPQLVAQFLVSRNINDQVTRISADILEFLSNNWVQNLGTFLLVVAFAFFYITVVFNANEIAENLQKQGGFIPGIRPGKQTAKYLRSVSFKLTAVGGLFLGILAVAPGLLVQFGVISASLMSGTGLLIVVGVALDMKRQVESMVVVRSYDRYL